MLLLSCGERRPGARSAFCGGQAEYQIDSMIRSAGTRARSVARLTSEADELSNRHRTRSSAANTIEPR